MPPCRDGPIIGKFVIWYQLIGSFGEIGIGMLYYSTVKIGISKVKTLKID